MQTKPHMMGRRTVKKLIKPIQHLRPLEEPVILPNTPSPQPPPAKKPNLGNHTPPINLDLSDSHNIETKEEPLDVPDDPLLESRYEDHTENKPMMNARLHEPSSSGNWNSDGKADQCSPGNYFFYGRCLLYWTIF